MLACAAGRAQFNFSPAAGGRGRETLKKARFTADHLLVPGYPPLPYELTAVEGSDVAADDASGSGHCSGQSSSSSSSSSGADGAGGGGGAARPSERRTFRLRDILSSLLPSTPSDRAAPGRTQLLLIHNFPPCVAQGCGGEVGWGGRGDWGSIRGEVEGVGGHRQGGRWDGGRVRLQP